MRWRVSQAAGGHLEKRIRIENLFDLIDLVFVDAKFNLNVVVFSYLQIKQTSLLLPPYLIKKVFSIVLTVGPMVATQSCLFRL